MEKYSSKSIDETRKMVLPLELRGEIGLKDGDTVVLQKIRNMVVMYPSKENPSENSYLLTIDQLGRLEFPAELMQDMGWEIKGWIAIYYADDGTVILK